MKTKTPEAALRITSYNVCYTKLLRLNLGDWLSHFTYAVCRDGEISLFTMRQGIQELYTA